MNELSRLKQEVADYLAGQEGFDGIKILTAWAGAERDFPLRNAAIAVGLESIEAAPGSFGRYWGEAQQQPLVGNGVTLTLRLDLYTPQKQGGSALHELYEALCAGLLAAACPFGLQKVWCDAPAWEPSALAYHLPVRATLRAALLGTGDALTLQDFDVRYI